MPAARGNRETIRRRGAPPRARVEVELEFSLGPHQYRIVRSLNNAELYQDGDPSPIANSIGAVTERVTRLARHDAGRVLQHLLHRTEGAAVMARHDRPRAGPVPFSRARLRADPGGPGPSQGTPNRAPLSPRSAARRPRRSGRARCRRGERKEPPRHGAEGGGCRHEALARAEAKLAEIVLAGSRCSISARPPLALETEIRVADPRISAAAERVERLEREMAEGKEAAPVA